jgi:hypothetical protein
MFSYLKHLMPVATLCALIPLIVQGATNSAAPAAQSSLEKGKQLRWYDATAWGVEGRAWPESKRVRWFDRLPAAAEKTVTKEVWERSRPSTGMMVRFLTDAASIHVHYRLLKADLGMAHMPPTGVSGVDLYGRDEAGHWRWVQVVRPTEQEMKTEIVRELTPGKREYALYLPLYNGVESLAIGVPAGTQFEGLPPRAKPLVFYGTSTTQGACASRPGMACTAILGRRLDCHVVNLGFSGNGRMDAAIGELLVQIDAAGYVIDCVGNMAEKDITEKCVALVKQLRAVRPTTPIFLLEGDHSPNSWIQPATLKMKDDKNVALRTAFTKLQQEGIRKLFYIPGRKFFGDDSEGVVDGHPSDLGFMRQADVLEPALRIVLRD